MDSKELELPGKEVHEYSVQKKEIELANKLIDGMTSKWVPSQYHDEYRDLLLKLIERKISAGETKAIDVELPEEAPAPRTINFMDVLKQSVAHAAKSRTQSITRAKKPMARGRRPKKQRAG